MKEGATLIGCQGSGVSSCKSSNLTVFRGLMLPSLIRIEGGGSTSSKSRSSKERILGVCCYLITNAKTPMHGILWYMMV